MSEQTKGIKTIIFDLGNVVIDLHYERAADQFCDLSGVKSNELDELLVSSEALKSFEVGGLGEEEFRNEICRLLKIEIKDDYFDSIWNAILGEISGRRVKAMLELKKRFSTFVLSNTNSIHLRSFNQSLKEAYGYDGVHELVHQTYYSHEVEMRKPNRDIYEFVLHDQRLHPHEVLFIDDREDNIEAAKALGIKGFLNNNVDDWLTIFQF